jgi:hypothetical protein
MPQSKLTRLFKAHALAHAVSFRSRKKTKASATRCRSRRAREIDILENGTLGAVITGAGVHVTAEEAEELRGDAVAALRSGCAECQLCDRFRLKRP